MYRQYDFDGADCLPLTGYLAFRAQDYAHPREVLLDQDLDADQKRAILCAWASDASAVDSRPGFRWLPGTPGPVALTHVMAGLRALDSKRMLAADGEECSNLVFPPDLSKHRPSFRSSDAKW